jgi:hypothetical protein
MEVKSGNQGAVDPDDLLYIEDDGLTQNEDFKKTVAIPYFKCIFKDLLQWSDDKTKGINKLSILIVTFP